MVGKGADGQRPKQGDDRGICDASLGAVARHHRYSPRTGRRTTKLYLPDGGRYFWSRQAHDLGYACQREERADRFRRRAVKLNRQLGGEGWDTPREPAAEQRSCSCPMADDVSGAAKPMTSDTRASAKSARIASDERR